MSGSLSNYAENLAANWLFRTASVTRPSSRYLALHTTTPGENGTQNEATYEGYVRKAITFGAPAAGKISNSNAIEFAAPPLSEGLGAAGSGPRLTHWSLWTAQSGGNCLGWGNIKQVRSFGRGPLKFSAGDFIAQARGLTTFAKHLMLTWLLRSASVTRPTEWHMALHRLPPGDDGALGELVVSGYARQELSFGAPSSGVLVAADDVTFGPAPESWPPVGFYSIWDADSAGNCLLVKQLAREFRIDTAASLVFGSNGLNLRFN